MKRKETAEVPLTPDFQLRPAEVVAPPLTVEPQAHRDLP